MADNTNIMNNPAASASRIFAKVMDRLEDGFNAMSDEDKVDSIKSQIANGYIPPELRIDTDIKGDTPDGMGFTDRSDINRIRAMTSGGTDRNGNEIKDETSLGLGRDFAANLGINTSEMHYVKDIETGKKLDIKDNIAANMSPEYATEVKSVYIMNDYSKAHRSEFSIKIDGKEKHIPFQDLRITTFIFEKYDGSSDYAAYYTNEAGYKLGDVPDAYIEGFNWEGKLPAIDDFKDKIYTYEGIDYSAIKTEIEAYASAKVAETKEAVYLSQMDKIEAQKDERKEIEEVFKDRMEAVKIVYNGISARFDEMGEVLSGIKSEIYSARDNCITAEKSGNKADIEEAKGELIDKIKTYLDTRNSFESELSKADMDYVKGELISSEKSYVNVRDYNERTYGDASKEIRNPDSKTYDIDNKFVFATDSTKGVLIAESRNSHDLRNLNNEKIENAAEAGRDYLENKVKDWNEAHPDNKLSMDDNGIVKDADGKEYLSYFREGINYTDKETDGFIRVADLDDFHFDSPRDILESIFSQDGVSSDINSYEKDLLKALSGYEKDIEVGNNINDVDDNQTSNDISALISGGIKSENDIYKTDAHINPKGDIAISTTKLNEIKADVLKSLGVDIDRYSERKAELSKGVSLNDSEMESVKNSTLKEIKGEFSIYNSTRDKLTEDYKNKQNRNEIYSRLGVDINKLDSLMMEKIGTIKLTDKQMGYIEDQAKREGKGDAEKTEQIKADLIQERKEYFAESKARQELGIDIKEFQTIRNEINEKTVLPANAKDEIESRARNIAGYNEDKYLETLAKNSDTAKENKVEGTLIKEFRVNPKEFESRIGKEVSKVSDDLQKSADKIAKYSKNLDRMSIFGRLNGTNLDYNIDRYRLHKEINNYISKGGAVGEDKLVRSEYKMVEKFVDIVGILKSNYWETLIFRGLAKIQDRIDAKEDKIEKNDKNGNDKIIKDSEPVTAPDSNDKGRMPNRYDRLANDEAYRNRINPMIVREHYKDKAENTVDKTSKDENSVSSDHERIDIEKENKQEPDDNVTKEEKDINSDSDENRVENDKEPENKTSNEETDKLEQDNEDLTPDDIEIDSEDNMDTEEPQDIESDNSDALDTESDKDMDKDSVTDHDSDKADKEQDDKDTEKDKNDTDKDEERDNDDKDSVDNEDKDNIDSDPSINESDNTDIQPDDASSDNEENNVVSESSDNESLESETIEEKESDETTTSENERTDDIAQDSEESEEDVTEEYNKDDDAAVVNEELDDSGAVEKEESEIDKNIEDDKSVLEENDKDNIEDDNKENDKEENSVDKEDDAIAINEGENEKVSEDEDDSDDSEAKDVIAESTGNGSDDKSDDKDNDIDPDESDEAKKDFKEIVTDFFEGKDTLTDNLADFLKDQILNPFDLIESFADCIVDFIKDLSAGDIAGALDSVADMISLKYGEAAGDLADKFFDKIADGGVDTSTINEISNQYEGILEEKAPELEVEGNIGAADVSPEGSNLTGFEDTSLNQLENDTMTDFAQPEVMEPLANDIEVSDKVNSISDYINDLVDNGVFTAPDGVELTPADCNNIANDIVNDAISNGSMEIGSNGAEIGDYWPDDSVISNQISNYDPSEHQTEQNTDTAGNENDFIEADNYNMRDPFENTDTLNNTEAAQATEGAVEGGTGMEEAIEGAESVIESIGGAEEAIAILL